MYICIYIRILFHFQASKFSMYVGIAISTLPTGIATVPDKHAHVSYSPLSNTPIYQAVSHTYHSPRSFHSNHKGILDLTKQGNIYHDLVDHPLIGSPIIIHCGGGNLHGISVSLVSDPKWFKLNHVPKKASAST